MHPIYLPIAKHAPRVRQATRGDGAPRKNVLVNPRDLIIVTVVIAHLLAGGMFQFPRLWSMDYGASGGELSNHQPPPETAIVIHSLESPGRHPDYWRIEEGRHMIDEQEVRDKLSALVSNDLSLDDYEDWLVSKSWNMHRDSHPDAQRLVWSIESLLSENASNRLDDQQLRKRFKALLDNRVVTASIAPDARAIVFTQFVPAPLATFSGMLLIA